MPITYTESRITSITGGTYSLVQALADVDKTITIAIDEHGQHALMLGHGDHVRATLADKLSEHP